MTLIQRELKQGLPYLIILCKNQFNTRLEKDSTLSPYGGSLTALLRNQHHSIIQTADYDAGRVAVFS